MSKQLRLSIGLLAGIGTALLAIPTLFYLTHLGNFDSFFPGYVLDLALFLLSVVLGRLSYTSPSPRDRT